MDRGRSILGLPNRPPPELEFSESLDDETCPNCGWDTEQAREDPQRAFNDRILLAVEQSEGSPFTVQSATTLVAMYFRCPNNRTVKPDTDPTTQSESHDVPCHTFFTIEEDLTLGAMS